MKRGIMGIGRRLNARPQSGDTLIEVIVAMLLVGMMITGLVPLFTKIHTYELMNTAKVAAYSMAESQIEAIKSAPYDQIGTQNGDPPGNFPQSQTNLTFQNTPGIKYTMLTQIRYKPDPARGSTDATTVDYKDITVEVKAQAKNPVGDVSDIDYTPSSFYPDITMNTLVTREDQWGELPGGNIQVDAIEPDGTPVGNMTVNLSGSAGTTYQMVTDSATGDMPGGVLFAELPADTYTMTAADTAGIGPAGWLVNPGNGNAGGTQMLTITSYEPTQTLTFQVAPPCNLTLQFYLGGSLDKYSGNVQFSLPGWSSPIYTDPGTSSSFQIPDPVCPGTYTLIVPGYTVNGGTGLIVPDTNPDETVSVDLS